MTKPARIWRIRTALDKRPRVLCEAVPFNNLNLGGAY